MSRTIFKACRRSKVSASRTNLPPGTFPIASNSITYFIKWSARDDLHVQGCLILSQVGLLFPVNHAPKNWWHRAGVEPASAVTTAGVPFTALQSRFSKTCIPLPRALWTLPGLDFAKPYSRRPKRHKFSDRVPRFHGTPIRPECRELPASILFAHVFRFEHLASVGYLLEHPPVFQPTLRPLPEAIWSPAQAVRGQRSKNFCWLSGFPGLPGAQAGERLPQVSGSLRLGMRALFQTRPGEPRQPTTRDTIARPLWSASGKSNYL